MYNAFEDKQVFFLFCRKEVKKMQVSYLLQIHEKLWHVKSLSYHVCQCKIMSHVALYLSYDDILKWQETDDDATLTQLALAWFNIAVVSIIDASIL